MAVCVGEIELRGVQAIHTDEARRLALLPVVGQAGAVAQDLGRPPITLWLEGLTFGEDALAELEGLRAVQASAQPQLFAADIVTGTDLTEVLVVDVHVRQVAGSCDRYHYLLRLTEYVEPPEPPAIGLDEVMQGILAQAAAWADGALAGLDALTSPNALLQNLIDTPESLAHLDISDLATGFAEGVDQMQPEPLREALAIIGAGDSDKLEGTLSELDSNTPERIKDLAKAVASDPQVAKTLLLGDAAVALDNASFLKAIAGALAVQLGDDVPDYRDELGEESGADKLTKAMGDAEFTTVSGQLPGLGLPLDVELWNTKGIMVAITISDAEGNFEFERVRPGAYKLRVRGVVFKGGEE